MKTLVLWGKDHEERAKELAGAYGSEYREAKSKPAKVDGLTRLTFWGHGIPAEFCEMSVEVFVDRLLEWKDKNGTLDSVEILTCNGRYSGAGNQSFTDNVRDKLLRFRYRKLRGVRLRGLPDETTPSGKTCHFSILSRDATTKSWSYVATPGFFEGTSSQHETHMFGAKNFLDQLLVTPTGRQGYIQAYAQMMNLQKLTLQSPYAIFKKMDQKKVDDFNARMKSAKEDAFIMVGNSVGSLVWYLKDIK